MGERERDSATNLNAVLLHTTYQEEEEQRDRTWNERGTKSREEKERKKNKGTRPD